MEELESIELHKETIEISGERKLYNYTFSFGLESLADCSALSSPEEPG